MDIIQKIFDVVSSECDGRANAVCEMYPALCRCLEDSTKILGIVVDEINDSAGMEVLRLISNGRP